MRGKAGSNIGISCVGATSFTELAGDSDGVILNGITAVELDGTLYPFTTKATDLPATISIQQKRRKNMPKMAWTTIGNITSSSAT
jgi:hypothetical protein